MTHRDRVGDPSGQGAGRRGAAGDAGHRQGFQIMVGCMLATSLAMAPAVLVAQGAAFVDLDGPLLLKRDRPEGLRFEGSTLHPPEPALWG